MTTHGLCFATGKEMKINDPGSVAAPASRPGKGDREHERWLGDLERAWLANWTQSAGLQGAAALKDLRPASSATRAPAAEGSRVANDLQSPHAKASAPVRSREPDRAFAGGPGRDQAAVQAQPVHVEHGAGTPAVRPVRAPTEIDRPGDARTVGDSIGTAVAGSDSVPSSHTDEMRQSDARDDLSLAAVPQFRSGDGQAVSAVPDLEQVGVAQPEVRYSPRPQPFVPLPGNESVPVPSHVIARASGSAFSQEPQRLPREVDGPASEDVPATSGQRPSQAAGTLPDKTSLQVTTQEDRAVVTLRDAALSDPFQQAQVSRMLAVQLQQLGFHSIRTYVNGVMRETGPDSPDYPQTEQQNGPAAQRPVQRTLISSNKESR